MVKTGERVVPKPPEIKRCLLITCLLVVSSSTKENTLC